MVRIMEKTKLPAIVAIAAAVILLVALSGCTGPSDSPKQVSNLVANQMGSSLSPDYQVINSSQEAAQARQDAIYAQAQANNAAVYNQSLKVKQIVQVGQALQIVSLDDFLASPLDKTG